MTGHRHLHDWVELMSPPLRKLHDDLAPLIAGAKGSRGSHHAWRGGYKAHIEQALMIYTKLYSMLIGQSPFADSGEVEWAFSYMDGLEVLYFHDIEKPFMYPDEDHPEITETAWNTIGLPHGLSIGNKGERHLFRYYLIERYDIFFTEAQQNALRYVEGVPDHEYVGGCRVEWPLAALCHAADNLSARVLYDEGESSPWLASTLFGDAAE